MPGKVSHIQSGIKKENIITIALDDDKAVKYRDPNELSKHMRSKITNDDMYYLLIDEVQYAILKEELKSPENIRLYNVLNGLMRFRNVDIYVMVPSTKKLHCMRLKNSKKNGIANTHRYTRCGNQIGRIYQDFLISDRNAQAHLYNKCSRGISPYAA